MQDIRSSFSQTYYVANLFDHNLPCYIFWLKD